MLNKIMSFLLAFFVFIMTIAFGVFLILLGIEEESLIHKIIGSLLGLTAFYAFYKVYKYSKRKGVMNLIAVANSSPDLDELRQVKKVD